MINDVFVKTCFIWHNKTFIINAEINDMLFNMLGYGMGSNKQDFLPTKITVITKIDITLL